MKKVKITVLRKEYYPEYADAYLTGGASVGACPLMDVGDEFVFEGGATAPEGFCPWAWMDIYRNVSAISTGSTYEPWSNGPGRTVACCTDGIRPVVFLIEAGGDIAE